MLLLVVSVLTFPAEKKGKGKKEGVLMEIMTPPASAAEFPTEDRAPCAHVILRIYV